MSLSTRITRNWSLLWIGFWVLSALVASQWDDQYRLDQILLPCSGTTWFGTDAFGRPLLWLTLKASLKSIGIASFATLSTLILGLLFGSAIALAPPIIRYPLKRGLEILLALPSLLLALALAALYGPGESTLVLAILAGGLPPFIRLMQARAQELLEEGYVTAAKSMGANSTALLRTHLAHPLFMLGSVKLPTLLASALLSEAALSFMGVGAPPSTTTWGLLLAQGRDYLLEAPHVAIISGIPLILTLAALQQLSEIWIERKP